MNETIITFDGKDYEAKYNEKTKCYEIDLQAHGKGGLYEAKIAFKDIFGVLWKDTQTVQVFGKEKIKIETNKVFMWIFDYKDFSVKDIVEIANYEINIDEETNANTLVDVIKKTTAKAKDIVAIKKNNEIIYWGTVKEVQNDNGKLLYEFIIKYITNIFDQKVKLENQDMIKTVGIEDFIAKTITDNFISNVDKYMNKDYLEVNVKTHTKKQTSVSNVEDGIYNLHTWMTNCTQNYDIVYSFNIRDKKLVIDIENKSYDKELIDVQAHAISNYTEVFETDVVSKVEVLTSTETYTLYLLNTRTTTTDMTNIDRADGRSEMVYTENYEDAPQKALDVIKENSYNHNITFNMYNRNIKVGTPVAIKTKESVVHDTYISAIKITPKKFIEYTCGNIRINFIDKLLKERKS